MYVHVCPWYPNPQYCIHVSGALCHPEKFTTGTAASGGYRMARSWSGYQPIFLISIIDLFMVLRVGADQ